MKCTAKNKAEAARFYHVIVIDVTKFFMRLIYDGKKQSSLAMNFVLS